MIYPSKNAVYSGSTAQKAILFLFHIVMLCVFSLYAFRHNIGELFIGNDGPMMISLAYEQLHFFGISTALHTNFFQGLGNISFPINVSSMPGFWFKLYGAAGPSAWAMASTYTWFAVLLFITVMIVGFNYRFERNVCYAAAWLLTILFFPYFPGVGIYSITASAPAFVMYLFAAAVADVGIRRMGSLGWCSSACYAGVALAGIMIMLITSPAALILILPFLCVSAFISFLSAERAERIRMVTLAAALLLLAAACGWIEYVLGLILNTSSGFFIKELLDTYPKDRQYISILFQGKVNGQSIGPWLFIPGFLGAIAIFLFARRGYFFKSTLVDYVVIALLSAQIVLVFAGEGFVHQWGGSTAHAVRYYEIALFIACLLEMLNIYFSASRRDIPENISVRTAAIAVLSGQALLLIAGEWVMHRLGGWTGPALVYYEMPLFALYTLFAVFLVGACSKTIPGTFLAKGRQFIPSAQYTLPVFMVVAMTTWLWATPKAEPRNPAYYALSPAATPLTEDLERQIGIHSGSMFGGRVVSTIPGMLYKPQLQYFSKLNFLTGNDYQTTGLWLEGIPTLIEYNPLITPGFYSIIRRFLTAPEDVQNRSWTNFSRIDPQILRLLGVRFILSSAAHIEAAKERALLPVSGSDALHLFELDGANIAGISAKEVVIASNLSEAEDKMAAPAFDLHTAIVMNSEHELLPTLVAAKDSRISIEKGAYRIQAKSDGVTMLILPIEYSRCLNIKALTGNVPQAVRVDIALTGLIFNRTLDVTMVQEIGPFTNPRCRFKDYLDFKAVMARN